MNINLRKIWGEMTKPWGRAALFFVIFFSLIFFFNIWRGRQSTPIDTNISAASENVPPSESKGYSFRSSIPEPTSYSTRKEKRSDEPVISRVIQAATEQAIESPSPIPQTIFAKKESDPTFSDEFLPFGALLKCQLANAVESTNLDTPIFGYVIEDVYGPGGHLIIPAGSEIHGDAMKSSSRDRIGAQNKFILVFIDSGRELKLTASVLDHAPNPNNPSKWSETDGSGGLRGYQIKLDKYAEAKAIMGSALAAGASAFPEQLTQMGPFGNMTSTSKGGWQSAFSEGVGAGADIYARRLLEAMKELYYVRVDAGTYFYLYVRQTVSLADARIGGSKDQSDTRPGTESAAIQSIHIQ